MTLLPLENLLQNKLDELKKTGRYKGEENVIIGIKPAEGNNGPRYYLEGYGNKEFLRMNSNSYLGLSLNEQIIAAEEAAIKKYGAGPGAVRFISGT